MNKKYFLGSLLVLALTVTGCQNNNPGDNSDNSNSESSIIQPSKDPGEITGGTFKFDDNQHRARNTYCKSIKVFKSSKRILQHD